MKVYKPNISCLNGIRCLCCLWIMFLHTHIFTAFIPYTEPSMKYIREFPILGFLAQSTLAVDAFWILSGFLCEYQMHFKVDTKTALWPIWFMLNRLLRLYPLYLLSVLMNFASPMSKDCNSAKSVMKAVTFIDIFYSNDRIGVPDCAGAGWSVCVDVHGYIALILLFVLFESKPYKKYIYWLLFITSCALSAYVCYSNDISWPILLTGLQTQDPVEVKERARSSNGTWPDAIDLYQKINPKYDAESYEFKQMREKDATFSRSIYFTSIYQHGACVFLGGILAMNLIATAKGKGSMNMALSVIKMFACFIFMYLAMDLRMDIEHRSWLWTVIYDKATALALFFLIDLTLSLNQSDSIVSKCIDVMLSNKLWEMLSKFTYGLYLFHPIAIFLVSNPSVCDIENGGIGPENYGFLFIFKTLAYAFAGTLLLAIVLYYALEYPISALRYKFVHPRYAKKEKAKFA